MPRSLVVSGQSRPVKLELEDAEEHATKSLFGASHLHNAQQLATPRISRSELEDQRTPTGHRSFQAQQDQAPQHPHLVSPQPTRRPRMNEEYFDYLCAQYEQAAPSAYPYYAQSDLAASGYAPTAYDYASTGAMYDSMNAYGAAYDPTYGYYDASYAAAALPHLSEVPLRSIITKPIKLPDFSSSQIVPQQLDYMTPALVGMTPSMDSGAYLSPVPTYMSPQSSTTNSRTSISSASGSNIPSGQMSDSDLSSASTRSYHSSKSSRSGASSSPTKEKRFICPTCGEGFARNFNLKSHISCKHNNEKPFECNVCPKTFSRKHDTARHLAARHGYSQSDAQAEVQRRYPAGNGSLSN